MMAIVRLVRDHFLAQLLSLLINVRVSWQATWVHNGHVQSLRHRTSTTMVQKRTNGQICNALCERLIKNKFSQLCAKLQHANNHPVMHAWWNYQNNKSKDTHAKVQEK